MIKKLNIPNDKKDMVRNTLKENKYVSILGGKAKWKIKFKSNSKANNDKL